jgi:Glycosyl transferase family group 2
MAEHPPGEDGPPPEPWAGDQTLPDMVPGPVPGQPAAEHPTRQAALTAGSGSGRGRGLRRLGLALAALAVLAGTVALAVKLTGLTWHNARYVVYVVWLVPLAELTMVVLGQVHYRYRFRTARRGKFRLLIIQITTTGSEPKRVNEIIAQLRGYDLRISYQIWVVTEPGADAVYPAADRVIVVPAEFTARSERKARALEYSRLIRQAEGLATADVKILFNDDDVAPTRSYIRTAFIADYDVCEGITAPRVEYAGLPVAHFFASHVDDMRTRGCIVYCSVFQGILGKPLHVHGEGLTVTGAAEAKVTWNYPVFASEDLTFGQNAAKMGLRWGWFHEYVELTSPWTFRDFFKQRKRWLWGNIHAITHRDVLPLSRAVAIAMKYVFGSVVVAFSVTGLVLRLTHQLPASSPVYTVSKLAIVTWLSVFFACGWINASSAIGSRSDDSRLLAALGAVLMAPVSSMMTIVVIVVALAQGNPRTFEVIRKTRPDSDAPAGSLLRAGGT